MTRRVVDFGWLVGQRVVDVYPLGDEANLWQFVFEGEGRVAPECPWRLWRGGTPVLSSADHDQQYGYPARIDAASAALEHLAGCVVTSVGIRRGSADLLLHFTEDVHLEIIPLSSGYECWRVTSPTRFEVIGSSGSLSCFQYEASKQCHYMEPIDFDPCD